MDITKKQQGLLQHTLGNKTMYRNYFCANPGSLDSKELDVLVHLGLMWVKRHDQFPEGHDSYDVYYCTEKGKQLAFEDPGKDLLK